MPALAPRPPKWAAAGRWASLKHTQFFALQHLRCMSEWLNSGQMSLGLKYGHRPEAAVPGGLSVGVDLLGKRYPGRQSGARFGG